MTTPVKPAPILDHTQIGVDMYIPGPFKGGVGWWGDGYTSTLPRLSEHVDENMTVAERKRIADALSSFGFCNTPTTRCGSGYLWPNYLAGQVLRFGVRLDPEFLRAIGATNEPDTRSDTLGNVPERLAVMWQNSRATNYGYHGWSVPIQVASTEPGVGCGNVIAIVSLGGHGGISGTKEDVEATAAEIVRTYNGHAALADQHAACTARIEELERERASITNVLGLTPGDPVDSIVTRVGNLHRQIKYAKHTLAPYCPEADPSRCFLDGIVDLLVSAVLCPGKSMRAELARRRAHHAETKCDLATACGQLASTRSKYDELSAELDRLRVTLAETWAALAYTRDQLTNARDEIESLRADRRSVENQLITIARELNDPSANTVILDSSPPCAGFKGPRHYTHDSPGIQTAERSDFEFVGRWDRNAVSKRVTEWFKWIECDRDSDVPKVIIHRDSDGSIGSITVHNTVTDAEIAHVLTREAAGDFDS